jgi:predicted  nucleic acid-binding Zn-ribbon protein
MRTARLFLAAALALAAVPAAGCSSVKYSFWEMFGKEKRDLLKSALSGLVDDQNEAKEKFGTALDRVKALTGFQGGDLEAEYQKLKSAHEGAAASASAIDSRISEIQNVSSDLFSEWQTEIGQMQTASLKADSQRKLAETKARYETMHSSMLASRRQMDPALTLLNDQVLYLKHNLNAAAVGSLGGQMAEIERSIGALQSSIESSIREAQGFIDTMN